MSLCKYCNTQLIEGSKFCTLCGSEVSQTENCSDAAALHTQNCRQCDEVVSNTPICTQCGAEINKEFRFCDRCGASTDATGQTPQTTLPQAFAPLQISDSEEVITFEQLLTSTSERIPTPTLTPLPTMAPIQVNQEPPSLAPFYLVDDTKGKQSGSKRPFILFAAGVLVLIVVLATIIPKVISNFTKTPLGVAYIKEGDIKYSSLSKIKPKEISEGFIKSGQNQGGYYANILFSEDGRRMFYPENNSNRANSNTIYYCDVNLKAPKGKKIDSDITSYMINKSGTKVFYMKGTNNDLYVNDLSDSVKIDSNVVQYYFDETGNKLLYTTTDGTIYAKDGNKESKKVAENTQRSYISSDLKTIYYIKNNVLFLKSWDGDEEKIASDVSEVVKIYDTGEIYFLQMKTDELTPSSSLNYYESPSSSLNFYEFPSSNLYYYDKGKTKLITDSYAYVMNYSNDKPVLIYATYDQTTNTNMDTSGKTEFNIEGDLIAGPMNTIDIAFNINAVIGGETSKLEAGAEINCMINSAGNTIYYYQNYNQQTGYGDLYYVTIEGTSISEPILYEKEIWQFQLMNSGQVIFLKNVTDSIGDLYLDHKKIDSKVIINYSLVSNQLGPFVYTTDYDQIGNTFTLKLFNGDESVVIAKNVRMYEQMGEDQIVYLSVFNTESLTGNLYLYNGSRKNQLIDEDVSEIIYNFYRFYIWDRNMTSYISY